MSCSFNPQTIGGMDDGMGSHFVVDTVSGATLTLSGGTLSLTVPVNLDSDNYFEAEEILMHMVSQAIAVFHLEREDRERTAIDTHRDKSNQRLAKRLPNMSPAEVDSLRALVEADTLPIGPSRGVRNELLAVIDANRPPALNAAD